jgi:DNA repair photolyase
MINPFYGELFSYPIPLELSHNYCSNKCAYCFANLNNPNRRAEVSKVANQLKKFNIKNDMVSVLLQNKMAICLSNKTDPFAQSNYKIAIPQIDVINEMEIPISYHTRGGKRFDEFYSKRNIPKTLFYISICHTDDVIRKLIEPGATDLNYRWELAKMLQDEEHEVVIGLNPFVKEWIDKDLFIQKCITYGIKNVVIQPLHLNPEQNKNLSETETNNIGEVILSNARKRNSPYYEDVKIFIDDLVSLGINAYDTQNFNKSNIMEAWHKGLNNATFKTYYDFYHWCLINKDDNEAIFFEEFYNFMKPDIFIEDQKYTLYNYITSLDRSFRKTRQRGKSIESKMTFKELCLMIWNDETSVKNISRNESFAIVGEIDNKKRFILESDENDNLIYSFNKNNFEYQLFNPLNLIKYD